MSATVTYKNTTLTTVDNQTRVLETSGTYLEDDITIVDVTPSYIDGNNLSYGLTDGTLPIVSVAVVDSAELDE